jgi:hypothetical protein
VVAWNANPGVHLRAWDGQAWREVGASASGLGLGPTRGPTRTTLALDDRHRPVVGWTCPSRPAERGDVCLRRWDGTAWSELAGSASGGGVSRTPGASMLADLALDRSGWPVVAWQEMPVAPTDPPPHVRVRRFDGTAWRDLAAGAAAAHLVPAPRLSVQKVPLRLGPRGEIVVAWDTDVTPVEAPLVEPGDSEAFARVWNGRAWAALGDAGAGGVSATARHTRGVALALDPSGQPILAWSDSTPGNYEIYLRRFAPGTRR